MNNTEKLNDADLENVTGGIDKQNPWALEIWYYNSESRQESYFHGSYPSKDAAINARDQINVRKAEYGFHPKLTKIYKAI